MNPSSMAAAWSAAIAVILLAAASHVPQRVQALRPARPRSVRLVPRLPSRQRASVPSDTVLDQLPDVVSLLALAVGAGLTVPTALPVLSRAAPEAMRDGLRTAQQALADGRPVSAAVTTLRAAWGDTAEPLLHTIDDHLRYGTALGPSLERVAIECRLRRRRAAEVRARRVPVLLLFPLVLCTLPAFGLLTVAPLVAGTLGSLDLSPLEAPASDTPQP